MPTQTLTEDGQVRREVNEAYEAAWPAGFA